MADNFHIHVRSEGPESLMIAMRLAFTGHSKASHYVLHPEKGLIFLWVWDDKNTMIHIAKAQCPEPQCKNGLIYISPENVRRCPRCYGKGYLRPPQNRVELSVTKLLFPMGYESAANFTWDWLQTLPSSEFRNNLDHDGSNGKGWEVYNEDWGHVAEHYQAICAILPSWMWYGK